MGASVVADNTQSCYVKYYKCDNVFVGLSILQIAEYNYVYVRVL